jgi:hypothetical protein
MVRTRGAAREREHAGGEHGLLRWWEQRLCGDGAMRWRRQRGCEKVQKMRRVPQARLPAECGCVASGLV